MRRILSILLENEAGALSRIVGLFSQRGYNIDSLTVANTDDPSLSRITLTTHGDQKVLEQITKQVNKLVDVLKVTDLTEGAHVERELMLIKLAARSSAAREEIKRSADIFRGQVIDMTKNTYTIQLSGEASKLDAFVAATQEMTEIIEVVRTGVSSLARGEKALRP